MFLRNFTKATGIAALMSVAGAFASANAADSDEALEQVRAKVTESFEVIDREHVHRSEVDGWYKIQKGSIVAYVSEDARYLLQGDLIDLETSVNLTEIARDQGRREILATITDDKVIAFTPKDVKHSVTVFTDTGCTYCRRLHSQIDEYLANGIEVRYILYPRNGPASREWITSEKVWCASDRNGALTAAKLDREFQTSACDASMIEDHYLLGQQIGLTGTPAIVLEDGKLIAGYMPAAALAEHLNGGGSGVSPR